MTVALVLAATVAFTHLAERSKGTEEAFVTPAVELDSISTPTAETREHIEAQPSIIGLPSHALWDSPQPSPDAHQDATRRRQIADDFDSDEDQPTAKKRISGTFEVVRTKLSRHIWHNASIRRQSSASSIGNSEEEVARRAELKRLMHKRIQDELQLEQGNEKSNNKSTPSIQCLSSVTNLAGPRDNIEFAVSKLSALNSCTSLDQRPKPTTLAPCEDPGDPERQSNGGPESSLNHGSFAQSVNETNGAVRCLQPAIVSTEPCPASRHVSFPQSISHNSFQLSNGTSRLDRILGPDNGFSSRRDSSSMDGHSALGIWLIAQGLRSRDSSNILLDDAEDENAALQNESFDHPMGVDRIAEVLASSMHSTARSREETSLEQARGAKAKFNQVVNQTPQFATAEFSTRSRQSEREAPSQTKGVVDSRALACILNSLVDNASSNYTSKLPSFEPSPARSHQNLHSLNSQDVQNLQLSPFEWHGNSPLCSDFVGSEERNSDIQYKENQPTKSGSYANTQWARHSPQMMYDTGSLSQSETTSFVQREVELRTIQKRFGEVLSRKKLPLPTSSRFREEFADPIRGRTGRASFIDKIHLTVPRRFKTGSRSQDVAEQENTPRMSLNTNLDSVPHDMGIAYNREESSKQKLKRPSNLSIRSHMQLSSQVYQRPNSDRQESTTDLWQRAIRLEAEERHSSNTHISTPKSKRGQVLSNNHSLNLKVGLERGDSTGNSSLSTRNPNREPSQLTPNADELPTNDPLKSLIQRWATEMRPGVSGFEDGIGREDSKKLTKPPLSWSRFPSHTREERTRHASIKDNVKPKDFAIKEITPDGTVIWVTHPDFKVEDLGDKALTRSFSAKIGQVVKSKLTWFLPLRNVHLAEKKVTGKSRIISRGARQLEYPELEILPTESGYRELQVLGKEIDNMKGRKRSLCLEDALQRSRSARSLGSRISALMQEAAMSGCNDHEETLTVKQPLIAPATPASGPPSLLPDSAAPTDIFVTPQSHFSFSDETQQDDKSEVESTKSERPARKSLTITVETKGHLRSFTWAGLSQNEVCDSSRLDDFREALEMLLRDKGATGSAESLSNYDSDVGSNTSSGSNIP
ncbi:hypothetical protein AK830_g7229 [Neonectria ditissima]|uniref:Uncharacterized protein n=1 Tax=Neonectria ditissima TaxID=78410 RepID=A0A0P7BGN3_9HYPO|nr:hypothetical protein AK830_g7229 [Neonectria ditissima]